MNKACNKCGETKPLEEFAKDKYRPDGTMNSCRICRKIDQVKWRENNKPRVREYHKQYRRDNHAAFLKYERQYRRDNPAQIKKSNGIRSARQAQATPGWFEQEAVREFYEVAHILRSTGDDCVVDHIVPIGGATVCGLHCIANLQLITPAQNCAKGYTTWPDMPT